MATFQDCQISGSQESTYKTYVAPTRSWEFTDESFDWDKNVAQGKGLRVSSRTWRSGRRVLTRGEGKGDLNLDVLSKGMGILFDAAFGASTVTQISASAAWQQVYTLGDTPKSLSIQKSEPQADGTLTTLTLLGCMVDSFEIANENGGLLTSKFTFDVGDYTTSQAYVNTASAPYAGVNPFHFGQAAIKVGGTVTLGTSTTLATSTGVTTIGVRDFSMSVNNNLKDDRYNYGNTVTVNSATQVRKSKPTVGMREITGKFTAEYDQTTLRDAWLNDTDVPLLLTFTGATIASTAETFQVALPAVKLESGPPKSNGGDLITIEHTFTVLDGLVAAQPVQVNYISTDTAL